MLNDREPFFLRERRIECFESVERIMHKEWPWLRLRFSGGPRYVTQIFITHASLAKALVATIGTADEDDEYTYTSHTLANAARGDKYAYSLPVQARTETLLISGVMEFIEAQDIDVFALLTPLSHLASHSGEDLNRLADSYLADLVESKL